MAILNTAGNASVRGYGFTSGGVSKVLISSTPGPAATITTYSGYIVFQFTASATLNVGAGAPGTADVLLVKGGSAGSAGGFPFIGGNGGAGGTVKQNPATTITANSPIPVVIGGQSTDSTFGPLSSTPGSAGGTGGTGANSPLSTVATNGGNGPTNNYLTGSPQNWAGGGGGGASFPNPTAGSGGSAGGGAGAPGAPIPRPIPQGAPYSFSGSPGSANTGGGGGGGGSSGNSPGGGGAGGSGVVIARFPDAQFRTS